MKSILTVFLFLLVVSGVFGQTELEIFHPEKKRFFLFVDGLKENETPKSRVKIKNLSEGPHHLKVIFESKELNNPQLKVDLEVGKNYVYQIKLYSNLNRKWYAINLESSSDWKPKQIEKKVGNDTLSTGELKVAATKADSIIKSLEPKQSITKPEDTVMVKDSVKVTAKPTTDFNCTTPLHPHGFVLLSKQISEFSPENVKIQKTKELIKKNCISSIQLMELLQLFDFEVSKLEIAAFAYPYCFDPANYTFVEDVFEFESSVQELHNQIYSAN